MNPIGERRGERRAVRPTCEQAEVRSPKPARANRRGFTLLELIAAAFVLGAAAVMTAQIVVWSRTVGRAADEERLAWQEASNCLELLTADGYQAVTPRRAGDCRLSDMASRALSAGQLTVTVTPLDEPLWPKRITAEVAWEAGPALPRRAVRLTTVLYAPQRRGEGEKP